MTAKLIDGAALAACVREQVARDAAILTVQGMRPGLAVVLVGDSPASLVYVSKKVEACAQAGLYSVLDRLPEHITEAALVQRIQELNADVSIHGILIQLPLPAHINAQHVLGMILPSKDVDGFTIGNAGALMTGAPLIKPCTPYGVMKMLESIDTPLSGAEAVIVGASNIVGKPMALLLLHAGATVTICHSKTRDLGAQTRRADILIAAAGHAGLITGDMVKPGAVVIDVGTNRIAHGPRTGKLCGDVEFASVAPIASAISPVPGGVGPMTVAMLMVNTVESARRILHSKEAA